MFVCAVSDVTERSGECTLGERAAETLHQSGLHNDADVLS